MMTFTGFQNPICANFLVFLSLPPSLFPQTQHLINHIRSACSHLLHLYVRSASIYVTGRPYVVWDTSMNSITSHDPRCITSHKICKEMTSPWQECLFSTRHYVRGPKGIRLKLRHIFHVLHHTLLYVMCFGKGPKVFYYYLQLQLVDAKQEKTFVHCLMWNMKIEEGKPNFLLKMKQSLLSRYYAWLRFPSM